MRDSIGVIIGNAIANTSAGSPVRMYDLDMCRSRDIETGEYVSGGAVYRVNAHGVQHCTGYVVGAVFVSDRDWQD